MRKCTDKRIGELIGLYEFGALEPPDLDAFLDHMINCAYCHEQVYAMEPLTSVFRDHRQAVQRGEIPPDIGAVEEAFGNIAPPRFWFGPPVLAAAALLLVVGVALVGLYLTLGPPETNVADQPGGSASEREIAGVGRSQWHDLQIPKAAYIPPKSDDPYRRPTAAFLQAMAAYEENRFTDAAEQLETLSQIEVKHAREVNFYLGVSWLLAGRSQEAMTPLRRAVQSSVGAQREQSHYYLALAYLKTNQLRPALSDLEAVIQLDGAHRAEAERLKQQVIERIR